MAQMQRLMGRLLENTAWRSLPAIALAAILGMAFGRSVLGPVSVVKGSSMLPTYPPGTMLHTDGISSSLQRGDVVLLDDGDKEYAVKRIVGLPGETVRIWRGYVFINREMLFEPYLPRNTYTYPKEGLGATFVLSNSEYFVLGDNRLNSSDSRFYGPLEATCIKRRVPLPDSFTPPHFCRFTLAIAGKGIILPL